jgi:hypothetical protein
VAAALLSMLAQAVAIASKRRGLRLRGVKKGFYLMMI